MTVVSKTIRVEEEKGESRSGSGIDLAIPVHLIPMQMFRQIQQTRPGRQIFPLAARGTLFLVTCRRGTNVGRAGLIEKFRRICQERPTPTRDKSLGTDITVPPGSGKLSRGTSTPAGSVGQSLAQTASRSDSLFRRHSLHLRGRAHRRGPQPDAWRTYMIALTASGEGCHTDTRTCATCPPQ